MVWSNCAENLIWYRLGIENACGPGTQNADGMSLLLTNPLQHILNYGNIRASVLFNLYM